MIYSSRLRLRAPERADLPQFVAWLNDPEVRENLSLYLPLSQAREEQWFEAMLQREVDTHPLVIEIQVGKGWKMIGNCGFHNLDWRNRSGELGIFIGDKSEWNKGYGTDTMRLLLKHGFETLNLHRVFLRVFESNPRGWRAYQKAGFIEEGRMRQAEFKNGRYWDVFFMSVLRDEWTAGEKGDL
ncbi:MAG: GNAT family N-acetyltransferase [Chloroflexi bacterium]|nr:GNAT family N-acetyltransferase [Chloroflexota bacterium]